MTRKGAQRLTILVVAFVVVPYFGGLLTLTLLCKVFGKCMLGLLCLFYAVCF
jgi:hypothetical protein